MQNEKFNLISLRNLRQDTSNPWPDSVKNKAPHKVFLLLSIIDGIERGWIKSGKIKLSDQLTDTFYSYWNSIMGEHRNTRISTPFTHMDRHIWELLDDKTAKLKSELFDFLSGEENRVNARLILMKEFFDPKTANLVSELKNSEDEAWKYSLEIENILNEPFQAFHDKSGKKKTVKRNEQVRQRAFSHSVKKKYNYHCAICRSKVVTHSGASIVEGAHIIPWEESYNDDIRNGISMCRNHHWMFDHWLITIRDDFTIKISAWLFHNSNIVEGLNQLRDTEILLPIEKSSFPAVEALQIHNQNFEFHNEG